MELFFKDIRGQISILMQISKRSCSLISHVSKETSLASPLRTRKPKSLIKRDSYFVDYCSVIAQGGRGGDGCIAFMQLFKNPLAGPSGGDGGNGGHVIFQVNPSIKSFARMQPVLRGENGENGTGKHMHGASGNHKIVEVPMGTLVKKFDHHENIIADLSAPDAKFIAARGGSGGHGNHFFLSNKNRHPEVAEVGADGEKNKYILELRIMAHVGLVGFPNAGKSTLLRAISRARPKVASYPFTTLKPHIGIVHYDDYEQLAVADLPGIIPDAHQNRGLGLAFLRHIQRCACICYVIDMSYESPSEQLKCLKYELEQYEEGLSRRPFAVVANKCDLPGWEEKINKLSSDSDIPVYPISAKTGYNVRVVLDFMKKMYDMHSKQLFSW